MLDDESIECLLLCFPGDELVEVVIKFGVVHETELVGSCAVGVLATAVARKGRICGLVGAVESSDQT